MSGKKILVMISAGIACMLLTACGGLSAGQMPGDDAVLGQQIIINGIDCSEKSIQDAKAILLEQQQEMIQQLTFHIQAGDRDITLEGTELPLYSNLDEVLSEAARLMKYNGIGREDRVFQTSLSLNEEDAKPIMEQCAKALNRNPKAAKAVFDRKEEGMFAFYEGESGITVNQQALLQRLTECLKQHQTNVEAPHEETAPNYTLEMAKADHQLIASYTTSFEKEPYHATNRVFNMKKAAKLIDGTTLQPGEEFDMNAILGNRNAKNGWKTAPGIRDGKYEQEYGGGVCQVSTTVFNAAMMADLNITERQHHSWPLGYVDIGRDATISTGGPNFKFVNSTDGELLLATEVDDENDTITASIYGKPLPNGITIGVSSEQTGTLEGVETEYVLDESLPQGTKLVDRESRAGKQSRTYKEYYDANGTLIRKTIAYEDTYHSVQGRVYVSSDVYYG